MNIFDLAAKISLNSGGFTKGVDAAKKGMGTLVSGVASGTKKIEQLGSTAMNAYTGLATAVATGVGTLVKLSTESYGSYEQLVGGVETLFGAGGKSLEEYAEADGKTVAAVADKYDSLMRAQKNVLDAAAGAYKTAGLSANEYIETVTSFSASLLQSLGGDTEKAAEYADMAITDMSDNANKMGTDMSLIQNAYQGFAKANYTMLDNLKLGYGGTKTEMQRLIEDAAELDDSVDASSMSFDNIVRAIHAVQTEMGITGTTAKEAATTIQGSAASMKAAWSNFLTGLADDTQDIGNLADQLLDSVGIYADNLLPRIETTFDSIVRLIDDRADDIGDLAGSALLTVANKAPAVISTATNVIRGIAKELVKRKGEIKDAGLTLFNSFLESFGDIADEAMPLVEEFVPAIAEGFISYKSTLFGVGIDIVMAIVNGVSKNGNAKKLADKLASAVTGGVTKINENLDDFLEAGMSILMAIGDGIIDNADLLIDSAFETVDKLIAFISDEENASKLANTAVDILSKLATGIGDNLDELIPAAVKAVSELARQLTTPENLNKMLNAAWSLIKGLAIGIIRALPELAKGVTDVIENLTTWLFNGWNGIEADASEQGKRVGESFCSGMSDATEKGMAEVSAKISNPFTIIAEGIDIMLGNRPDLKENPGGSNLMEGIWYIIHGIEGIHEGIAESDPTNPANVENNLREHLQNNMVGYSGNSAPIVSGGGALSNPFLEIPGRTPYPPVPPVTSTKTDGETYEGAKETEQKNVTIGDVTIVIDGNKFEDEEALAEYTAKALQDLYERGEAVYD